MLPEPIAATIQVTTVLEKLGIPYLVGGSLASTIHGLVRTTQDSDLVAEMRPEHIEPFVWALESEFYVDEEMIAGRYFLLNRTSRLWLPPQKIPC